MPTRKLYYEDAHQSAFRAVVTACRQSDKGYEITLDATCFYPEGGGQAADTGTLDSVHVLHTREDGAEIVHLCDAPLAVGRPSPARLTGLPAFCGCSCTPGSISSPAFSTAAMA